MSNILYFKPNDKSNYNQDYSNLTTLEQYKTEMDKLDEWYNKRNAELTAAMDKLAKEQNMILDLYCSKNKELSDKLIGRRKKGQ